MEEKSETIFKGLLPANWILRPYLPDYGIDYALELFDYIDHKSRLAQTMGEHVFIELKFAAPNRGEKGRSSLSFECSKIPPKANRQRSFDDPCIGLRIDTDELLTVERIGPGVPVLLRLLVTLDRTARFFCVLEPI